MTTATVSFSIGSQLRLYLLEARSELLKAWRMPAYALPTILFPCAFYLFFAVAFDRSRVGGATMATYLIGTYGAFGVIGASLFGFGIGVATERGQGWMLVKRATPMPVGAYFAAKTVMALVFGAIIVLLLSALGVAFGGVRVDVVAWAGLFATLVLGAVPFCALGLLLGYAAGPNSAPAIVNLIYLPLSFCSGLWVPVRALPGFLHRLAPWLPPYHYAQLALRWLHADEGGSPLGHVLYLAAFTAACLLLARLAYQRDEGKTYG